MWKLFFILIAYLLDITSRSKKMMDFTQMHHNLFSMIRTAKTNRKRASRLGTSSVERLKRGSYGPVWKGCRRSNTGKTLAFQVMVGLPVGSISTTWTPKWDSLTRIARLRASSANFLAAYAPAVRAAMRPLS